MAFAFCARISALDRASKSASAPTRPAKDALHSSMPKGTDGEAFDRSVRTDRFRNATTKLVTMIKRLLKIKIKDG